MLHIRIVNALLQKFWLIWWAVFFLEFSVWIYLQYTVYTTKWLWIVHKCTNWDNCVIPNISHPSTCTLKDVFTLDRVSRELTLRLLMAGHSLSASRGKSLSNSPSSCRAVRLGSSVASSELADIVWRATEAAMRTKESEETSQTRFVF